MKEVQHETVNIMEYKNSQTSNNAILKATSLKSDTSLV